MKLSRPKSMLGLILVGFSLVALPLVVSVIQALVYMDRLAQQSERLVMRSIQVTRQNQLLAEQITALERNARQYLVLNDPELLSLYEEKQQRFDLTLNTLEGLVHDETIMSYLQRMRSDSETIVQLLREQRLNDETALVEQFSRLGEMAVWIAAQSYYFIDREQTSLQDTASDASRNMIWQTAALIPITLLLVVLFTLLIERPIRQIGRAIQGLGETRLTEAIIVGGPPELEALGQKLDWLRRRLFALEQEKNRFLRHMSHELKTPLASIREGTELLLDGTVGSLDAKQREVVDILRGSGVELQRLIENLLNFSAWQEQTTQVNPKRFPLQALIETVVGQHRPGIIAKHLTLEMRIDDVTLYADRDKIRTALDNLLSNAVKFSPVNGAVYVAAQIADGRVQIDIADSGCGVTLAERERIFDPFYQGHAPQSSTVRGTGIGLSVARECIQAHGGRIEIVDGIYTGAHFRINLPIDTAQNQD